MDKMHRFLTHIFLFLCLTIFLSDSGQVRQFKAGIKKRTGPLEDRDDSNDLLITKKAWFELEIDDMPVGRIEIGLFCETVPITCNNFAALTKGFERRGQFLTYKNTIFHRVVKDFVIQGGDVTEGDGSGSISIYGKSFDDENFFLIPYGPGYVAMANTGPHTNGSQFFITLVKARWLGGKHVVFGKIIKGMDIIERIGELDTDEYHFPKKIVRIIDSGIQPVIEPFLVSKDE
ncbi:peptidyl-prolyl cis-trans isomerase B-like [Saccoglossus kowalevskii]|uniref:Peptidyl-prolyl cis-trans isomerase n=1 Tax=Saccoglossus kowalevskii TaxID=10224 RepID=A0ABM0GYD8_SACKO|nr:PREDICTED: peptidyl-prolyl cis-trans isomerase B-like [Saccoglossus kowalevskii]